MSPAPRHPFCFALLIAAASCGSSQSQDCSPAAFGVEGGTAFEPKEHALPDACRFAYPIPVGTDVLISSEQQYAEVFRGCLPQPSTDGGELDGGSLDAGASSGLDFNTQRLLLAVHEGYGLQLSWAQMVDGNPHLALDARRACGGAPPQVTQLALIFPAQGEPAIHYCPKAACPRVWPPPP